MSLVKSVYDYKTLQKKQIEGKRLYETPDGNAVASVTTILSATKDNTHLNEWRNRVGHEQAKAITTEASGIGTRMHKYLEKYIENGVWPSAGSNPYGQQAEKMAFVIKESALDQVDAIWGSEVSLYMPKLYAGTADLIGSYKGNPSIMDFKQSNKPKKIEWVEDYFLQLVAYAEAHNELYSTSINEGHIFMCCRDLTYQQFDIWPDEYSAWRHEWYERVYQYYDK